MNGQLTPKRSMSWSDIGQNQLSPISRSDSGPNQRPPIPSFLKGFARGLQQRQLDTIAYFLSQRENSFKDNDLPESDPDEPQKIHSKTGTSQTRDSPDAGWDSPGDDVTLDPPIFQLDSLIGLVLYTVEEYRFQSQLKHFTEQLLHLTLEHLQKLSRSVVNELKRAQLSQRATVAVQKQAEDRLTRITDHREQVKALLQVMEKSRSSNRGQGQKIETAEERRIGYVLSDQQRCLVKLWDSLEPTAVTVEGILTGELNLLQTYLLRRCGSKAADLTLILETGLREGLAFIHDRDIASASNMFSNMGFDPDSKLHQICMYTTNRALRDYLVTELQKKGKLSMDECEMVAHMKQLESLYTCHSFNTAKTLREEEIRCSEARKRHSEPSLPPLLSYEVMTFNLDMECGDLVSSEVSNSKTSCYSRVILDWIRHWTPEQRNNIILEYKVKHKDFSTLSSSMSASRFWCYMCRHLDVPRLQAWIRCQYPDEGEATPGAWPYSEPITRDMLEFITTCPRYIKEELMDELAKRGVFVPVEMSDLHLLMRRLGRIDAIFKQPHLVTATNNKHGISVADLHYHMIKWCTEQDLPQLMCLYLDYFNLSEGQVDLNLVGVIIENLPNWVSILLHFRCIGSFENVPEMIVHAWSLPPPTQSELVHHSVQTMLDHNLILRALAVLPYDVQQYKQLVNEAEPAVIQLFSCYPQLQYAMFGEKLSHNVRRTPLTVYQLLKNNGALAVDRLFGWQKTHTAADDDSFQTLPHFADELLVAKYGQQVSLDMTYYLRQGRPSSAFCTVLRQIAESGVRTLPYNRIHEACVMAYRTALLNYTDLTISASCISLLELLSIDATPLRIHIEVANQIAAYINSRKYDFQNDKVKVIQKYIGFMMMRCIMGNTAAQNKMLNWLAAATYWKIREMHVQRCSMEAGILWQLVLLWCSHYELPLSTHYLSDCALADNWVHFITYAERYNYPADQLFNVVKLFPQHSLRENLVCVVNTVQHQELDKVKHTEGNAVQKSAEPLDLLLIIQQVQGVEEPAYRLCTQAVTLKCPVLAVLAVYYQEEVVAQCIVAWILASVPEVVQNREQCTIQWYACTADTVRTQLASLRDLLIDNDLDRILYKALFVFQPDCHLLPFLVFMQFLRDNKPRSDCMQHLTEFKNKYHHLRRISSFMPAGSVQSVFTLAWVEEAVVGFTQHFLATCQNVCQIELLLKCMDELSILRFSVCQVTNVSNLLKLHQLTKDTSVTMDYMILGNCDSPGYQQSCDQFIGSLLDKNYFHEARIASEILGVPNHNVTVRQLTVETEELLSNEMWSMANIRVSHWKHCRELMDQHRVSGVIAAEFFLANIELCQSDSEKATVYEMAYDWLHTKCDGTFLELEHEVFVKMYRCRILDYFEHKEVYLSAAKKKVSPIKLQKLELLTFEPKMYDLNVPQREPLSCDDAKALQFLIGGLMNRGSLTEVVRVIQHFGCDFTDFNIILTCLELANGNLKPEDLSVEMRNIVSGPRPLRIQRMSTTRGSFSVNFCAKTVASLISHYDVDITTDSTCPVTECIQMLSEKIVHAQHCAGFIKTAYNISKALSQKFNWVLMLDDFAVLYRLLASESESRHTLAKDYILAASMDDNQVSSFLCDCIVEALQLSTGVISRVCTSYGTDRPISLQTELDATGLHVVSRTRSMSDLLQMCDKPAVLGTRFLDTVGAMVSANSLTPQNVFVVEVELLIYAHDCFTLSCNMEGISSVLRTARTLTQALEEAEEFTIMISLLLGLARYSEMTYVFDTLMKHQQFELLFRKGVDRETRLRLAILEYLQRHHPDDLEAYSMTALKFTMYREIAQMLEQEAEQNLKKLKDNMFENTVEKQAILNKAMRYYGDASESYKKEKCFRHADICLNKARLVALQLQLLSTKTQVLHLGRKEIKDFVCKHNTFYEAYIVCEAYSCHAFWTDAIYHQFIKEGSDKYLQDLRNHIVLSPALILDVAARYRVDSKSSNMQMAAQMRKLLGYCHDLVILHKASTMLGMTDVIRETAKADVMAAAYLRDKGLQT